MLEGTRDAVGNAVLPGRTGSTEVSPAARAEGQQLTRSLCLIPPHTAPLDPQRQSLLWPLRHILCGGLEHCD